MNTQTVQTSIRLARDDWSSSPNAYTAPLSWADQLTNGALVRMVGAAIPAITIAVFLNTTSPAIASLQDIVGFEKRIFTNPAIHYGTVDESLLDAEDDPALLAFLDYLDQQMAAHPELIVEADYAQLERIAKLVEGVELEDDD